MTGAGRAGGLVFAAVMVLAGAVLAFGYRGVAAWLRASTLAWRGAGRIRRGFRVRVVPVRLAGALTAIAGILIIAVIVPQ